MVGDYLPEIDGYSYGARPWVGTPKVSSCFDANHARSLMEVTSEVHPWVSAPVYAANNFCLLVLTSRVPDHRPYTLPIQRVHVWDPPLVSSDGS